MKRGKQRVLRRVFQHAGLRHRLAVHLDRQLVEVEVQRQARSRWRLVGKASWVELADLLAGQFCLWFPTTTTMEVTGDGVRVQMSDNSKAKERCG